MSVEVGRAFAMERAMPSPGPPVCRATAVSRFPVGGCGEIVQSRDNGAVAALRPELARVLAACRGLATLDEHAEALALLTRVESGRQRIRALLDELRSLGLLVSQDEVLARARSGEVQEPGAGTTLGAVGFITRDRPRALEQALAACVDNLERHGRRARLVLADDSPKAETGRQCREVLRRAATCGAFYAGPAEKRAFAAALAHEAGVDEEVPRFALLDELGIGTSTGANRNALLLENAGEAFLSVDDDIQCRLVRSPEHEAGVSLCSEADPTEFRFFDTRDEALASVHFEEADVLAVHEDVLGRSVPSLAGADMGLGGACFHVLGSLQRRRGRVAAAAGGVVGDSGMHSGVGLLFSDGPTRLRLTASESDYRRAFRSREVLRLARRVSVGHDMPFMSGLISLDHRSFLPPFFPVCRNEDGVFGQTLSLCFPDVYFAHLPWAAVHAAAPGRTYLPRVAMAGSGVRLSDVVISLMLSWQAGPVPRSPAEHVARLGGYLSDLAGMPAEDFEDFLRSALLHRTSVIALKLEGLLKKHEQQPVWWAEDAREYLDTLVSSACRKDHVVPLDLPEGTGEERAALTRRIIGCFGALLSSWPALTAAAARLRERGSPLCRPVEGRP